MINSRDKKQCSGCTACANICPYQAIQMKPDNLGFLYPVIDSARCTECGICDSVCPFNHVCNLNDSLPQPYPYAVRHKDMNQLRSSQSGAAFIAISNWILEHKGVVYGAGYTDSFEVVHKRSVTKKGRDEFRGSKYVQSHPGNLFQQIKTDLLNGKEVLFSGTPCQTSGLYFYVNSALRKKLYLIDLVCHGVVSPYMWRDYLRYLEGKYKKRIISVNFRDKSFGWHSHRESFCFNDGYTIYPYFSIYQDSLLRPSCGICPFACLKRPSDITIGDFWGIERNHPLMGADNKGCSLLLCNTLKGKKLFDEIKDSVQFQLVGIEECLQPNLIHPTFIPHYHLLLEWSYRSGGIVLVMLVLKIIKKIVRITNLIKYGIS